MNKKRRINPVVAFFGITFGFSWALWAPQVLMGKEMMILRVLGTFGPLYSALFVSLVWGGWDELRRLIKPFTFWRFNIVWYLFCFFATALLAFTSIGIALALGSKVFIFNPIGEIYMVIPVFLYVLIFSVLGEETGWRGFALPRMQKRYGPLAASLYLGMIWGLWHLPLFLIEGDFHRDIPFWLFMIQEIALSLVMTWLYNNTRKSLLSVHLFHGASNTTLGILPVLPMSTGGDLRVLRVMVILLILLALGIVLSGTLGGRTAKGE